VILGLCNQIAIPTSCCRLAASRPSKAPASTQPRHEPGPEQTCPGETRPCRTPSPPLCRIFHPYLVPRQPRARAPSLPAIKQEASRRAIALQRTCRTRPVFWSSAGTPVIAPVSFGIINQFQSDSTMALGHFLPSLVAFAMESAHRDSVEERRPGSCSRPGKSV